MNPLHKLAVRFDSDKAAHGYSEFYHKEFGPIRDEPVKLLEIGIWKGASLRMWLGYFGFGEIVGLDINECETTPDPRLTVLQGDQTDKARLREIGLEHGPFDIVIDDGGHTMDMQQTSLGVLFSFVKPGGVYIIEDLHTAFCRRSRYNKDNQITTLQMVLDYVKTRRIESPSISEEDRRFLNECIQECQIWQRGKSRLCCFRRKR